MKIIIAGAGEVGTHLAKMLSQEKQDIILMDPNEERLNFTNSSMEILPMVGNPTSIRDLEEAGIRKADLFVSVTPEETTNVAASILASKLGAHKTLARINNYEYLLPKNKELFEKMGIDSMIYPEMLAAKEIVTAVRRPWTRQYWELFGGALILIGVKVRDNSRLVNKHLFRITERTETLSYRCHQTAERDHYSPWYGSYRIGRYRFFLQRLKAISKTSGCMRASETPK